MGGGGGVGARENVRIKFMQGKTQRKQIHAQDGQNAERRKQKAER